MRLLHQMMLQDQHKCQNATHILYDYSKIILQLVCSRSTFIFGSLMTDLEHFTRLVVLFSSPIERLSVHI